MWLSRTRRESGHIFHDRELVYMRRDTDVQRPIQAYKAQLIKKFRTTKVTPAYILEKDVIFTGCY